MSAPCLFFDLDGMLAEPFRAISESIRYAMSELGLPELDDAEVRRCIGPPIQRSFTRILGAANGPEDDVRVAQAVALYRKHHAETFLEFYEFHPEAEGALESFAREHRLYVVTAKPWKFARPLLEERRLARFFAEIYGPELDGLRADKGDLIQYILERESIAPGDAIMIGDREHDVIAAKKNGVRAIGVRWGYAAPGELERAGADRICATWVELAQAVREMA